ncbi:MAG: hypothetical protein K6F14_00915 [Clostridiales bacterium]|nr:hypothetical protein [Clostridiales bacterium]
MKSLGERIRIGYRNGIFGRLFNRTDNGKGRTSTLIFAILNSTLTILSGDIFYVGYLTLYGFDISQIGIISTIPTITSLIGILTPSLLKKMKRPKLSLILGRSIRFGVGLLGITIAPMIISDKDTLLTVIIIITFVSNILSSLIEPCYTEWQANFLTQDVRADFFLVQGFASALIAYPISMLVSMLLDNLKGSPDQLTVMIICRFVSFALGIIGTLIVTLVPKYTGYKAQTKKIDLKNIIVAPFKYRPYLFTTMVYLVYLFANSIVGPTLNSYILNVIKVPYTYPTAINATYFLFFIFFGKMYSHLVKKLGYFKLLAILSFVQGFTYLAYALVTEDNYMWLMTAVRFSQHIIGVGTGIVASSLVYENLPVVDRADYLMFRNIAVQGITLLAYALGNAIVAVVDKMGMTITLFGIERLVYGTAICLAINGGIQVLLGLSMPLFVKIINKYKIKDQKQLEVQAEVIGAVDSPAPEEPKEQKTE